MDGDYTHTFKLANLLANYKNNQPQICINTCYSIGALFAVGAFTRLTAFILAGMMAVAYFMAHMPSSFFPIQNGGDAAVLFCFIFLYFAATGAGPYSVDANRNK
jgi:uncharacterized membrane protein YphA (DoxX/SURF4 family)